MGKYKNTQMFYSYDYSWNVRDLSRATKYVDFENNNILS